MTQLMVAVAFRDHNRKVVTVGVRALGFVARLLPARIVTGMGNRLLSWYRVEYRIGMGAWQPMEHGLQLTAEGVAA